MSYLVFAVFVLMALYVIWKSKLPSGKKGWLYFVLKMVGIYVITMVLASILFILENYFFVIPYGAAERYTGISFLSLATLWGIQFLMRLFLSLFGGMLKFHEKYNSDNYEKIKGFTNSLSPSPLLVLRLFLSVGAILIYYGIWLS
ncbi:hypothetical protein SMC37_003422 [Cronobacter sakazakii]|uniref:hypothetical protein n=1 Tax=Cronobacter sakazakii TaxID=28141 RepID=UPI00025F698C|nr:hypothetical protein [Cronobacter sakazakii]AFK01398.1 hypothetical protein ES15_3824 [Cronobacter sakazakii ES15]ELY2478091.1 hypothetical protein [Cronobacter sakazakii]ELY2734110.1 hypothetical protein [Cronobacter sakazakii]ELY5838816.1 hypothetical protein [Cronobacter sakazakii]ELY6210130.1 hypothetical protein [Cronobacter sakazakii]